MSSINKVILVGRLGSDPESRVTNTGNNVATISLATSERYKDKAGEWAERTEWHRVVCWNTLADLAVKYLRKGRQVYVEGRIQTRSWETDAGEKKYSTEIIASNLTFLDSGRESEGAPQQQRGNDDPHRRAAKSLGTAARPAADMHDDIPF